MSTTLSSFCRLLRSSSVARVVICEERQTRVLPSGATMKEGADEVEDSINQLNTHSLVSRRARLGEGRY